MKKYFTIGMSRFYFLLILFINLTISSLAQDVQVNLVSPVSATPGSQITYNIYVTNNSNGTNASTATNVTVRNPAVANLTVNSLTAVRGSGTGGYSVVPTISSVSSLQGTGLVIPSLPPGSVVKLTIIGTVGSTNATNFNNTATISYVNDTNSSNNTSSAITYIYSDYCGSAVYSFDAATTMSNRPNAPTGGVLNLYYKLTSGTAVPSLGNQIIIPVTYSELKNDYGGTNNWKQLSNFGSGVSIPIRADNYGAGSVYNNLPSKNRGTRAGSGSTDYTFNNLIRNNSILPIGTYSIQIGNLPTLANNERFKGANLLSVLTSGNAASDRRRGQWQSGYWLKPLIQGSVFTNAATAGTIAIDMQYGQEYIFRYAAFGNDVAKDNNRGLVFNGSNTLTFTFDDSVTINSITPATQTVESGKAPTNLTVDATSASNTLTYQWYRNSTNSNTGGTLITGATSATYTPPTNNGVGTQYYYVIVKSSGTCTATSTPLAVSVFATNDIQVNLVSPVAVQPGSEIEYKIYVTNNSNGTSAQNATDVIVKNPAISNLTLTSITVANGSGSGGYSVVPTNTNILDLQGEGLIIPTLPPGSAVVFTIKGTVGTVDGTNFVNTATVEYVNDTNVANNTSSVTTYINSDKCATTIYTLNPSLTVSNNSVSQRGGTVNLYYVRTSGTAIPGIGEQFTVPVVYSSMDNNYNATNNWKGIYTTNGVTLGLNGNGTGSGSVYNNLPALNTGNKSHTNNASDPTFTNRIRGNTLRALGTFSVNIGNLPELPSNVYYKNSNFITTNTQTQQVNLGSNWQSAFWNRSLIQNQVSTTAANTINIDMQYGQTYIYRYSAFGNSVAGDSNRGVNFLSSNTVTFMYDDSVVIDSITPKEQTAQKGKAATNLTVSASSVSKTFTYQWYSNTTNSNTGGNLITGATSASYAPPTTAEGTLYYYVVVNGSGTCSTTSDPVKVDVVSTLDIQINLVSPVSVEPGSEIGYKIYVTNNSNGPEEGIATNVIVKNPAIQNLTISEITAVNGSGTGGYSVIPTDLSVSSLQNGGLVIPSLPPGAVVEFTVKGVVGNTDGSSYINIATVEFPGDLITSNNISSVKTFINTDYCGTSVYTLDPALTASNNNVNVRGGSFNLYYKLTSGIAIPEFGEQFTIPVNYSSMNNDYGATNNWNGFYTTDGVNIGFTATGAVGGLYNNLPTANRGNKTNTNAALDATFINLIRNNTIHSLGTFNLSIGDLPKLPENVKYKGSNLISTATRGNWVNINNVSTWQSAYWSKPLIQNQVLNTSVYTENTNMQFGQTYVYRYSAFGNSNASASNRGVIFNSSNTITFSYKDNITINSITPDWQTTEKNDEVEPIVVEAESSLGSNLTYQWYSNRIENNTDGTLIPGATSSSYTPPTTKGGTMFYYVEVKGAGECITASQPVKIVVDEACYRDPVTNGTILDTNVGISALNRPAFGDGDNWPQIRKGGWIVLEDKQKGFVLNRVQFTDDDNNPETPDVPLGIPASNFVEGMTLYDTTSKCLKVYTTNEDGLTAWHCMTSPTCPE